MKEFKKELWENKKTKGWYVTLGEAICTTNAYDGTEMLIYADYHTRKLFVRDKKEFYEKFERLEE